MKSACPNKRAGSDISGVAREGAQGKTPPFKLQKRGLSENLSNF